MKSFRAAIAMLGLALTTDLRTGVSLFCPGVSPTERFTLRHILLTFLIEQKGLAHSARVCYRCHRWTGSRVPVGRRFDARVPRHQAGQPKQQSQALAAPDQGDATFVFSNPRGTLE